MKPTDYEYDRFADIKRLDFITGILKQTVPPNGRILDVGCGNGVISRHLGKFGYRVLGIDISPETIETARSLTRLDQVRFEVMSAEDLQASGSVYDAIICSEVLEHLQDPDSLIRVLYHSLKDEGKLIVTVPNGAGPREALVTRPVLRWRRGNRWPWRLVSWLKKALGYRGTTLQSGADNLDHIQFFRKRDLERLSRDHHFIITRFGKANFIEDVFPFSFFTRRIKFLQKLDCRIADILPYGCSGGFFSVWEKEPRAPGS